MTSKRELEASHRERVTRATRELRSKLHASTQALPHADSYPVPSVLTSERPEQVFVPSEFCLICGSEAASGMLLPGSVVFYFCGRHLAAGQRLAENAWRRYRQKQEHRRILAEMRERADKKAQLLWLLLSREMGE